MGTSPGTVGVSPGEDDPAVPPDPCGPGTVGISPAKAVMESRDVSIEAARNRFIVFSSSTDARILT